VSIDTFIPAVWSRQILSRLHNSLVAGQPDVINTDYEGEIAGVGSSVKIHGIGPITVLDYTKNSDLTAAETLTDTEVVLTIDRAKAFNFQVDDIDAMQQMPKVRDEASREAAYALANEEDAYLLSLHASAGITTNFGSTATPLVPTSSTAYELISDMATALDVANCPPDGRFVIVPPWYEGFMRKDSRFVSYSEAAYETLQTGLIGMAAGIKIYKSNNIANTAGAKYKVIFGHRSMWTVASQISKVEAYRPPLRFADALKGLHLYGAKVARPTIMGVATVSSA
jgi:N4-gp56 family major capsid protein